MRHVLTYMVLIFFMYTIKKMKYFVPAALTLLLVSIILFMYSGSSIVPSSGVGGSCKNKNTDKGEIKGLDLKS